MKEQIDTGQIRIVAAGIAFYLFLSLFPLPPTWRFTLCD